MSSLPPPTPHKKYAAPTSPPPRTPLLPYKTNLPYTINLDQLATHGWLSLPMTNSSSDPLYSAFYALFSSSASFLGLPEEEKSKYAKRDARAYQGSEEGYSKVPGEKCMITLRKASTTPDEFELRERSSKAWEASARMMRDVLSAIEESLGMDEGVLVRTMGPRLEMPKEGEDSVATLLRMFRYDRPTSEGGSRTPVEPRVVAEAHRDLGLLSLVIGHTPGLECWDPAAEKWVACEENKYSAEGGEAQLTATLLAGQTLAKFTNWRYSAGRHRVFVHPASAHSEASTNTSPLTDHRYRYSLVHAIRAHLPVVVSSSQFITAVTGPCPPELQFSDVTIGEIYAAISAAHWNVNISVEERRKQELEVQERVRKEREAREAQSTGRSRSSRLSWLKGLLHLSRRRQDAQAVH